jgi:L-fuconolactonase
VKIDAHQHFWNLEKVAYPWMDSAYGPICRNFEAEELEPLLHKAGIHTTVLVQSMNSYEDTEYMLQVAAEKEWVGAVVGGVPLNIPSVADTKLREYAKNPYFKGVCHLIHEEKDPDWVIRNSVIEGLKVLASYGMTFDCRGVSESSEASEAYPLIG